MQTERQNSALLRWSPWMVVGALVLTAGMFSLVVPRMTDLYSFIHKEFGDFSPETPAIMAQLLSEPRWIWPVVLATSAALLAFGSKNAHRHVVAAVFLGIANIAVLLGMAQAMMGVACGSTLTINQ